MRRDDYVSGMYFLSLYVLAAVVQSIVIFQIDFQIYQLSSFSQWILVLAAVLLVGFAVVLKYFHHKGFRAVFILGIISMAGQLLQLTSFYVAFLLPIKELAPFYPPLTVLSLALAFVYGLGLIFSSAGKNYWLKVSGIFTLIATGLAACLLIWSWVEQPNPLSPELIKFNHWVTLVSSLLPVPLIVLFYKELSMLVRSKETSVRSKVSESFFALGAIALLLILILGINLATESYGVTHVSERTKAIAEPFETRRFVNEDGDTLLYRLLLPKYYDPGKRYPMVICLHGGAGWGTDNIRQFDGSLFARLLANTANREKFAAFVFVPQCPPGSSWGNLPDLPAIDSLVFESIEALEAEFSIDQSRLYVVGHSLGGYGTWNFIGKHPEKFAAAIPVAGEGDLKQAENMLEVPIWAFHGANDRNVPVSGSRDMIAAIRKAGGNPRYTESPHGGHSWDIVTDTPGVLDWLFAQKRE
ncbi:hypothetical protein GCM10009119_10440 [Algoriphagus jejuensis]|uniref:Peptidase S9 prolyl oligopeptidase catalytic domain-containing protein n=1 Tax=Algoriphagus jejuensis TaxID=419934 RepID=A0ABN1MXV6_9BACT